MKRFRKVLCWGAGSFLFLALAVVTLVWWGMRPTTGPRIDSYPDPRAALLVIDLQEDYTGPRAKKPYRDGGRAVMVSNSLLVQARERGAVIVFIRNVIDNPLVSACMGGLNAPGSPGTEMDRRLLIFPGTVTFAKKRSDAFSNGELDVYLRDHHVNHLLLTGLDGAHCINATARGALNRGYRVTLFQDGIATESGTSIETLARRWREAGAHVRKGANI